MPINFEKPTAQTDWKNATFAAAQITIKAFGITDPASAAKTAVSLYPIIEKFNEAIAGIETRTPENLAYKWLSLTLAEATAQILNRLRRETILQASTLDGATRTFLEKAMDIRPAAKFDTLAIESPASHDAFEPAKSALGDLISSVTSWTEWDSKKWQVAFDECIAQASQKIFATCHDDLSGIINTVSGPASAALHKEIAWARHYEWINKLFQLDPVFSPDGKVETPLSELYIRQRCYWHEEYEVESKDSRDIKKRWRAYLGDLHEVIEEWLSNSKKQPIHVITGGPGSGKSSFAKALASETAERGRHRVLFVELQRMALSKDLYRDIEGYFKKRHRPTGNIGSPGFDANPLDWAKTDNRPVLIVFDGLDEITQDSEHAKEIARDFILNVHRLLNEQNTDGGQLRAVILGRNAACQNGLDAAGLPLETMLNVAPIRKLDQDDLLPATRSHEDGNNVDFVELPESLIADQRPDYWDKWQRSQGLQQPEVPNAITAAELSDLNVEPLLLHLLILSDFCGDRWKEASQNRNLVYYDILTQIHTRNKKEDKAGKQLCQRQFFLLMECLGLTAWHGNLRTGDEKTFMSIRDIHALTLKRELKNFAQADLDSMVLQTHARKVDGAEPGFEFIHKSFGEYLAARALVNIAQRTVRRMNNSDDPIDEETATQEWVKLVGTAELTPEILKFLKDEVKQEQDSASLQATKSALETLLVWVDTNGMPVGAEVSGSFRTKENVQRCAETALFAVAFSVTQQLGRASETTERLQIAWDDKSYGPIRMLHRLQATTEGIAKQILGKLNLAKAKLTYANLHNSDLSGADLSGANLRGADLSKANLSRANLSRAILRRAYLIMAHLRGADLRGADLIRADLIEADLRGADLRGAKLIEADLSRADLRGADLRGADLSGADLSRANLSRANLGGAYLIKAELSGAELQSADLADCTLALISARSADFTKTDHLDPNTVKSFFGVRSGNGKTLLPAHCDYPEFWHVADDGETENWEQHQRYETAYRGWRAKQALYRPTTAA
ncbi:pentapeptide repeat-containing protein [Shimia sp.]|uniref:pentapeptide repeat-containing protein n=1 Tax=Shimia sp. TaxID=1954381 RepID=UPI003BAB37B8